MIQVYPVLIFVECLFVQGLSSAAATVLDRSGNSPMLQQNLQRSRGLDVSQECDQETDQLTDNNQALKDADAAMLNAFDMEMSDDFMGVTLAVPVDVANDYAAACTQARGQLAGVASSQITCSNSAAKNLVIVYHLENIVQCFAASCDVDSADVIDEAVKEGVEGMGGGFTCVTDSVQEFMTDVPTPISSDDSGNSHKGGGGGIGAAITSVLFAAILLTVVFAVMHRYNNKRIKPRPQNDAVEMSHAPGLVDGDFTDEMGFHEQTGKIV